MWSVGCIFAEMILQRTPFPGNTDHNQLELIFAVCGSPTTEELPELVQLDFPIKKQASTLAKLFKEYASSGFLIDPSLLTILQPRSFRRRDAHAHAIS